MLNSNIGSKNLQWDDKWTVFTGFYAGSKNLLVLAMLINEENVSNILIWEKNNISNRAPYHELNNEKKCKC